MCLCILLLAVMMVMIFMSVAFGQTRSALACQFGLSLAQPRLKALPFSFSKVGGR